MPPDAVQLWEAAIQALQALSSADKHFGNGHAPFVVISKQSADKADKALQAVVELELQANKMSWSKLLTAM